MCLPSLLVVKPVIFLECYKLLESVGQKHPDPWTDRSQLPSGIRSLFLWLSRYQELLMASGIGPGKLTSALPCCKKMRWDRGMFNQKA